MPLHFVIKFVMYKVIFKSHLCGKVFFWQSVPHQHGTAVTEAMKTSSGYCLSYIGVHTCPCRAVRGKEEKTKQHNDKNKLKHHQAQFRSVRAAWLAKVFKLKTFSVLSFTSLLSFEIMIESWNENQQQLGGRNTFIFSGTLPLLFEQS